MRNSWTLCWLCLLLSEAAWAETPPELDRRIFPSDLVWSLGFKLNMDRMSHPREVDPGLMLGLRYGRWRTGAVDGESWHRFGQVKTDNTLTYDLNDASHFRTSLSASVVNMDHESPPSSDVQKPPVVRNDHRRPAKIVDRFLQCPQRIHVEVVRGFVQEQHVGT